MGLAIGAITVPICAYVADLTSGATFTMWNRCLQKAHDACAGSVWCSLLPHKAAQSRVLQTLQTIVPLMLKLDFMKAGAAFTFWS